jgi:hypothetical protein
MLTSKLLAQSGFGDVQILDRRETRQKSRHGGHELVCTFMVGSLPMKVIVKVINDAVRLRMLDELAGAVVRTGADLGPIVSPHHVTSSAIRYQGSYKGARVEIMDGSDLARKLIQLKIGVRSKGDPDYQFFGRLEEHGALALKFLRKEVK